MSVGATGSVCGVSLYEAGFDTALVDALATLVDQTRRAGVAVLQADEDRQPCA